MAPLIVQIASWVGFWLAGVAGLIGATTSVTGALRFSLAAMFVFTAVAHFVPRTRTDLVRMVPPALPAPGLLVSLTGVLELVGAIALLIPSLAWLAALALAAMLVALLPANVHAARVGLQITGRPVPPLALRLPLQLFWIGCLIWVSATSVA